MNPRVPADNDTLLAACDIETLRGSGPGGQHRNKTESAVRLRHRETGLVAQASERRSQHQNLEVAAERLRTLLERHFAPPPPPRRATRPTRGSQERRHAAKKVRAKIKQGRGRVGED
ncbi:MAG TPA: peptide chain release factor-like protein [Myxococcota bacterium]|nr:peptide chain release factor-like protein [Myxococcota bacterium]